MPPIINPRFFWPFDTGRPLSMNVDWVLCLYVAYLSFAWTGLQPKHEEPDPSCRQGVCIL